MIYTNENSASSDLKIFLMVKKCETETMRTFLLVSGHSGRVSDAALGSTHSVGDRKHQDRNGTVTRLFELNIYCLTSLLWNRLNVFPSLNSSSLRNYLISSRRLMP